MTMNGRSGRSSGAGEDWWVSCCRPKDTESEAVFIDYGTAVWRAHVCRSRSKLQPSDGCYQLIGRQQRTPD